MIRDQSMIRVDNPHDVIRHDGPGLSLPGPHFDATSSDNVLDFLDKANRTLIDRNATHKTVGDTIWQICGVLHVHRRSHSRDKWLDFVAKVRTQPILETLHQDAFTRRAFEKPRGYAGDATLLDYMYATEHFWSPPEMSWVGQRIYQWSTLCSACEGVKSRREVVAGQIDEMAKQKNKPDIMSLACGHFREAELSSAIIRRRMGRVVAIDSDEQSLNVVENDYGKYGVETAHATARELMSGRLKTGTFDLIYTSGLCDYLSDSMCQKLAKNLFDRLNPGGRLLLTNFVDNVEAVGYMEMFMDWNLIYRDRVQMMEMSAKIPERQVRRATCFSEDNYNIVFLSIERN